MYDKPSNNNGAGNGTRTRDPQLGKLMLYQLSYARSLWFRFENGVYLSSGLSARYAKTEAHPRPGAHSHSMVAGGLELMS